MTMSADNEDFAAWLRMRAAQRGYDFSRRGAGRGVARAAGLDESVVSRLFKGEQREPKVSTLRALAPLLGVSLRELLIRSGQATEEELPTTAAGPEDHIAGIVSGYGLEPDVQTEVAADVREILDILMRQRTRRDDTG